MTARLVDVGRLIGIAILDHVIVARGGYYSFRDEAKFIGPGDRTVAPTSANAHAISGR